MEAILKDRTFSYSVSLMLIAGVMVVVGHIDMATLNVLVAIWFKMPWPRS